jgi:von Willebrand factor type A domain
MRESSRFRLYQQSAREVSPCKQECQITASYLRRAKRGSTVKQSGTSCYVRTVRSVNGLEGFNLRPTSSAKSTGRRKLPQMAVLLFFAVGALRMPVFAQEQSEGVLRANVNLVLVDATVKTKAGQIMGDLKKEDFELREDGVAQNVQIFSRDELPLNVALVLDLSDSIGPFLGPLRDAANTALAALKPEDEVALFTFATEAELRVPFTNDKKKIAEQINAFKVGGATNINDGIFVAAK